MIEPMLAYDGGEKLPTLTSDWAMEPKLDGWRWQISCDQDSVKAYGGRKATDHTGQAPAIEQALRFLPTGTVLDGELVPTGAGMRSPVVSSLLARGGRDLVLVVFDVLAVAGHDTTRWSWADRRLLLDKIAPGFDEEFVRASRVYPVDQAIFDQWVDSGLEGAVVKHRDSTYQPGKRSRDWIKVKPRQTADAVVAGWEYGKGASNTNRCGALRVVLLESGVPTTVAYHAATADAELMVGRVIEMRHNGLMASGKPRHPVFSHVREDRSAPRKAA